MKATPTSSPLSDREAEHLARLHLVVGWLGLLVFIVLGSVLEGLHAFKVAWYLDVDHESRRFLFRLAHAHGALLSLLQLGASWTFSFAARGTRFPFVRLSSRSLLAALVLLPGGFFWGGLSAVDGDPGVGIVLVPAGAICLVVGVTLMVSLGIKAPRGTAEDDE